MKRNVVLCILVGSLIILGATWAASQNGPQKNPDSSPGCGHGGGPGFGHHGGPGGGPLLCPKMMASLGLEAGQQKEVEQLQNEFKDAVKPLENQLQSLQEQMHALWSTSTPDEKAILSLHKKMNSLHLKLGELKIQLHLDVLKVLTPEQQKKLVEMKGKPGGEGCMHGKKFSEPKN